MDKPVPSAAGRIKDIADHTQGNVNCTNAFRRYWSLFALQ